jgi:alpha-ketoglutarate-dependent taurine dioxygenase
MNLDHLFATANHHPVVVTPSSRTETEALQEYLIEDAPALHRLLLQHGAILFRGFDLTGPADLKTCAESLGARPFGYVGGDAPRSHVRRDVYTSTDHPASEVISLHNEMSYLPRWPRRVFFLCEIPAASGGQTSLAHGRDVLDALPTEIVANFRDKAVNYIRNFHPRWRVGKSWQDTYQTVDPAEAEAIIAGQGSICRWLSGDVLRVSTRCDAVMTHPETGDSVWFNQAEQYHPSALEPGLRLMVEELCGKDQVPLYCEYGDGSPVEESALAQIRHALSTCKLLFDWQRSDLLVIDNILMLHGRERFSGERKTFAYLSAT